MVPDVIEDVIHLVKLLADFKLATQLFDSGLALHAHLLIGSASETNIFPAIS